MRTPYIDASGAQFGLRPRPGHGLFAGFAKTPNLIGIHNVFQQHQQFFPSCVTHDDGLAMTRRIDDVFRGLEQFGYTHARLLVSYQSRGFLTDETKPIAFRMADYSTL
jgi:hypothetical protein